MVTLCSVGNGHHVQLAVLSTITSLNAADNEVLHIRFAEQAVQTGLVRQTADTHAAQASNPFMFKHVTHLKSSQHLDDIGPCVVMATPSMLQSGLSRYTCPCEI